MEFETNFAYICPDCLRIYGCKLNVFRFSGGQAHKFICRSKDCLADCASIKKTAPDQYNIEVLCPFCDEKHSKRATFSGIWQRPQSTVRCPNAAADIFFYGQDRDAINGLVNRTTEVFERSFSNGYTGVPGSDPMISEILMNLERLMSDHQISCVCGSENIGFELRGSSILLICRKCGSCKELRISKENLMRLINASGIVLGH